MSEIKVVIEHRVVHVNDSTPSPGGYDETPAGLRKKLREVDPAYENRSAKSRFLGFARINRRVYIALKESGVRRLTEEQFKALESLF